MGAAWVVLTVHTDIWSLDDVGLWLSGGEKGGNDDKLMYSETRAFK